MDNPNSELIKQVENIFGTAAREMQQEESRVPIPRSNISNANVQQFPSVPVVKAANTGTQPAANVNVVSSPPSANLGNQPVAANVVSRPPSANLGNQPVAANVVSRPASVNLGIPQVSKGVVVDETNIIGNYYKKYLKKELMNVDPTTIQKDNLIELVNQQIAYLMNAYRGDDSAYAQEIKSKLKIFKDRIQEFPNEIEKDTLDKIYNILKEFKNKIGKRSELENLRAQIKELKKRVAICPARAPSNNKSLDPLLKQKNKGFEDLVASLRQEIASLKQYYSKANQKSKNKNKKIEELEKQLEEIVAKEIQNLNNVSRQVPENLSGGDLAASLQNLTRSKQELRNKIGKLQTLKGKYKSNLNKALSNLNLKNANVKRLQEQINAKVSEYTPEQKQQFMNKISELNQKISVMEKNRADITLLTSERNALKREIDRVQKEKEKEKINLSQKDQSKIRNLENQISKMESQIKYKKNTNNQNNLEVQSLKQQLQQYINSNAQLKSNLTKKNANLNSLQKQIAALEQNKTAALAKVGNQSSQQIQELNNKIRGLEAQLLAAQSKSSQNVQAIQSATNQALQQKQAQYNQEIGNLKAALEEKTKLLETSSQKNQNNVRLQEEIARLQSEMQATAQKTAQEVEAIKAANTQAFQAEIDQRQQTISNLQQQLLSKNNQVKNEISRIKQESNTALKEEKDKLIGRIGELEQQIKNQELQLKKEKEEAVAGESLKAQQKNRETAAAIEQMKKELDAQRETAIKSFQNAKEQNKQAFEVEKANLLKSINDLKQELQARNSISQTEMANVVRRKNDELATQKATYNSQLQQLSSNLQAAKESKTQLEAAVQNKAILEQAISNQKQKLSVLEESQKNYNSLKQSKANNERVIQSLRDELILAKQGNTEEKRKLQEELAKLKAESNANKQELSRLKGANQEITQLKSNIDALRSARNEVNAGKKAIETQIETQRQEIENISRQLQKSEEERNVIASTLAQKEQELGQIRSSKNANNIKMRDEKVRLESEIRLLNEQLTDLNLLQGEKKALDEELQSSKKELENLSRRNKDWEALVGTLKKQIENESIKRQEYVEKAAKAMDLQKEVEELRLRNANSKVKNQQLQNALANSASSKTQLAQLQNEIDEAKRVIDQQREIIDRKSQPNAGVESMKRNYEKRIGELRTQLNQKSQNYKSLNSSLKTMQDKQAQELRKKNEELAALREESKTKEQIARPNETSRLRSKIKELENTVGKLETLDKINNQRRVRSNSASSQNSIATQNIPVKNHLRTIRHLEGELEKEINNSTRRRLESQLRKYKIANEKYIMNGKKKPIFNNIEKDYKVLMKYPKKPSKEARSNLKKQYGYLPQNVNRVVYDLLSNRKKKHVLESLLKRQITNNELF